MTAVDDVIANAQMELGKPYVYGDEGPGSFDCSGLMQFIFGKIGVSLPRTAAQQQDWAQPVTAPAPGDLVFWGNPAYHVALYVGGGKVIAAPQPGSKVQVQNMWGQPAGYGRVKGVGSALTPAIGAVTGVASTAGSWVADALGGARHLVLEGAFVVLGLGLLGYGAYRVVAPQVGKLATSVKGVL